MTGSYSPPGVRSWLRMSVYGLTTAFSARPAARNVMSRRIIMPHRSAQRLVIPRSGGVGSPLPPHHFVDPDRANGDVHPWTQDNVGRSPAFQRSRWPACGAWGCGCRFPRDTCSSSIELGRGGAISFPMRSSNARGRVLALSRPARPSVAAARAAQRSSDFIHFWRRVSSRRAASRHRVEPFGHSHIGGRLHHSFHLSADRSLTSIRSAARNWADIPGFPESQCQFVIGLDLACQFPNVAARDAELIVPCRFPSARSGVLSAHLVAQRLQLSHGSSRVHVVLLV